MIINIQETIQAMVNPWNCGYAKVVSLSSGATASPEIEHDLVHAHQYGEEKLNKFIDSRLLEQEDSVYLTMKNMKLKTFATQPKMNKSTSTNASLKADRSTFARLLVVAQQRDIDLQTILTYSLSPVSAALSSADGRSISKTTKAALLTTLESHCNTPSPSVDEIENASVQVDAMALIQSLPRSQLPSTFGELSQKLLLSALSLGDRFHASRIDVVGDRYDTISIKNIERDRRSHGTSETLTIYGPDQKLPKQWPKFMASASFKQALQSFLAKNWPTISINRNALVYVALTETCTLLSWTHDCVSPTVKIVEELAADHEEADTRLILHSEHATARGQSSVIWSPDTDVAMIALGTVASEPTKCVLFATGTGNKRRVLNLTAMSAHLGPTLSKGLIGLHALTGCDSTSSFYGKGKATCFKTFLSDEQSHHVLQDLGVTFIPSTDQLTAVERFVCRLYGSTTNSINETR